MPDSCVLRYRDFSDPTILRHKELIDERGLVWWGWWRKEAEPSHVEYWRDLSQRATEANPLTIGLFDRSRPEFFLASGDAISCVEKGRPVLSPSPEDTPVYYRDSPAPAWLRLRRILAVSEDRFRAEFGSVPKGEGTFFPAWRHGDRLRVDELEVFPVIEVEGTAIVHLSDLHFGDDFGFPERQTLGQTPLLQILTDDLDRLRIRPALVVVSGDITTRFDAGAMHGPALDFLLGLTETWRILKDQVVIIPGNHDIPLDKANPVNYSHERVFRSFLQNFYDVPSETVYLRRFSLARGPVLELLTMNSARLRTPELKEYGYVEWKLCESLLQSIDADEETVRIAVVHHHLVPAPRVEIPDPKAPISITIDAGEIIEGLHRHGFSFALHGHQHLPHICRLARGLRTTDGDRAIRWPNPYLIVIGAGSTGARQSRLPDQLRNNTYNLLELQDNRWSYRVRQFNAGMQPEDYIAPQLLP